MINYIILFLLTFLLIFLDHLVYTTFGLLISPIIFLLLFDVLALEGFFVLIIFLSLGLDVTFHYPLGLSLFTAVISLLVFKVFNMFVHTHNSVINLIPVFMFSVSLYFILQIAYYFPNTSLMFNFSWDTVVNIFIKALISTLLYLLFSNIVQYLRSDRSNSVKLK